jgi:hypothetical protein
VKRKSAGHEYWYQPAGSDFTFPFYRNLKAIWVKTGQNMYPGVVQQPPNSFITGVVRHKKLQTWHKSEQAQTTWTVSNAVLYKVLYSCSDCSVSCLLSLSFFFHYYGYDFGTTDVSTVHLYLRSAIQGSACWKCVACSCSPTSLIHMFPEM